MNTYWKVTSKETALAISEWHNRLKEAEGSFLRFSRRQGGSRSIFGSGFSRVAVKFNQEPNRDLWKPVGEFWVPKVKNRALKKEFDELEKAFPRRYDLESDLLGYDSFGAEGDQIGFRHMAFANHDEAWYILAQREWKPKESLGVERISDIEYEEARDKSKAKKVKK